MDDEKLTWVSTNYSDEQDIKIGPFAGLQIYIGGASILFGLMTTYILIKNLSWPLVTSSLVGAVIPLVTIVLLLKLVVGKASGYWLDFCEYQMIRLLKAPLFKLDKSKGGAK